MNIYEGLAGFQTGTPARSRNLPRSPLPWLESQVGKRSKVIYEYIGRNMAIVK